MSTETTEELNAELRRSWEHFRTTAVRIAELQSAMWGDYAELMTGLLNGKPTWGGINRTYWKFVGDEGMKFASALGGLGVDYARGVVELTREHEQRLWEQLRASAEESGPDDRAGGGGGGPKAAKTGPSPSPRSRRTKQ
ncbi:hypothetical protein SSP35_02_00650 [Streptomyces sp. NBRC 110611]|uniref:hypothetical protein n=1 Tax=Streptomyces sp. NBRC 110611 TaxID=1621259 RepID=UPI000837447F|nr:hypothetical protein [Streptomyces sp. NBRC 110611]GAU65698.1 hypothetical protein SSP35_02_00650 [Streptomyces sp. NBRC 110611]